MRMAGLSAGVMLVLFCVLAALNLDKGIIRMLVIFTIGAIIAAGFAAPYLLRRKPSMSIDGAGITLIPTFARRVYIPWKCLASARTAIRAKHHLRLEVDWTKLSGERYRPDRRQPSASAFRAAGASRTAPHRSRCKRA